MKYENNSARVPDHNTWVLLPHRTNWSLLVRSWKYELRNSTNHTPITHPQKWKQKRKPAFLDTRTSAHNNIWENKPSVFFLKTASYEVKIELLRCHVNYLHFRRVVSGAWCKFQLTRACWVRAQWHIPIVVCLLAYQTSPRDHVVMYSSDSIASFFLFF